MPIPPAVITLGIQAGVELIKQAPRLVAESRKAYESVKKRSGQQAPQDPAQSVTILSLRSTVESLQENLEALEAHSESQAELIARITWNQAALLRWLFRLTLFSVASSAIALAAILVAVLR